MAGSAGITGEARSARQAVRSRFTLFSAGATALAVALVLLSVFALDLNLGRLKQSFGWVEHTDAVLLQLTRIEASLIAGESGERGYLLTGDADYRESWEGAHQAIAGEVDELAALLSDNPEEEQRLRALRPLISDRFAEFKRVVDLGPEHLDEALAILKTARVEQLTPRIQAGLAELRRSELALLDQRQRQAEADASRLNLLAIAAGVLALASLAFGLILFQRQRARHRIEQLQSELIHVSRLNTMGQTASILAHEMKQPLTATGNYLRGARRLLEAPEAPAPGKIVEILGKAGAQVERATQIVGRLRSLVDKGETERASEDVRATVEEAISLTGPDRGEVSLRRQIEPDLPPALIDKVQIQQVLINLMRNAGEAMQGNPRREITVSARHAESMIEIAVADTGPGLAPQVAERLFQPFVSTKRDGMGVGLSICRTIVESHGGRIWTDTAPEGGAVFRFTLPAAPIGPTAI